MAPFDLPVDTHFQQRDGCCLAHVARPVSKPNALIVAGEVERGLS